MQSICIITRRGLALLLGWLVSAAAFSTLAGCTEQALRGDTRQATDTLTELNFQQVLDNVARFEENPDTVPSFAVASSGTVSITDQAGAGASPTYSPTLTNMQQGGGALPILSILFPFSVQRSVTENWSLTPVNNADCLRRLRCAFRLLAMGDATPNAAFCKQQMSEFFVGEEASLVNYFPPRGWYSVGARKDVPKDARYVGHHGAVYVWVTREGMNGLAVFAMGALDMATGQLHTPQRTVVRKYKGEPTTENLVESEVTTTEDDQAALEAIRKGRTPPPDRPRTNEPAQENPGLFLLPRPK